MNSRPCSDSVSGKTGWSVELAKGFPIRHINVCLLVCLLRQNFDQH